MKIAFHTFGCKLNQMETEAIAQTFINEGYEVVKDGEADLYFINTCAVTSRAEAKSRRMLCNLAEKHPHKVIAAGCLAQMKPLALDGLADFRLILGVQERMQAPNLLANAVAKVQVSAPQGVFPIESGNLFRSRSFIKIQDGCDHNCSYCIVPSLRGASVSLSAEAVIQRVKSALKIPREIVLTGVDIGSYKDVKGITLAGLLGKITTLPEVVRIRLSSIEPPGFTPDVLEVLINSPKICPHFHIPLQSGSDRILRRMNRKYTAEAYLDLTQQLAKNLPLARIGADIIVGFPDESEDDFSATYNLLKQSPITHIHIFPFSLRPGVSLTDPDNIPFEVKRERSEKLKRLIAERNKEFLKQNLGRIMTVFFESSSPCEGFTENYIRVVVDCEKVEGFHRVRLESILEGKKQVSGRIV
jgi:threonylcarbamoyladenosine tRNA methylthiotransferase MtaB